MRHTYTLKINFTGGIIPPGQLQKILEPAYQAGVRYVRFGLRQQLLMDVFHEDCAALQKKLRERGIACELDAAQYPNIMSSYPAEDVFTSDSWLSEGIYKDIFDGFGYRPQLKINISDNNQGFTPFFTGNLNWIASKIPHFWHLYVRFPKTNVIFEWKSLIYSNHVAHVCEKIEQTIDDNSPLFYGNEKADGEKLYRLAQPKLDCIHKPVAEPLELPSFRLPYYEGFNRYDSKTWLGIYRRDEQFSIRFLSDVCKLCLQTKVGQMCATPWKSLIIKGIDNESRPLWDTVLMRHQINVRHAANELNWQVEDNSEDGLALKHEVVKHLDRNDLRTFGVCFGIQTRPKSEVFGSIIIRRKPVFQLGGYEFLYLYDILYTEDFNPNSRKLFVFDRNLVKPHVGEQIKRLCQTYLRTRIGQQTEELFTQPAGENSMFQKAETPPPVFWHQCRHCLTVYDRQTGEPEKGIPAGTPFGDLPADYACPLCESGKADFVEVPQTAPELHAS